MNGDNVKVLTIAYDNGSEVLAYRLGGPRYDVAALMRRFAKRLGDRAHDIDRLELHFLDTEHPNVTVWAGDDTDPENIYNSDSMRQSIEEERK